MNRDTNRDDVERSVRHCYSTWGERYYDDYYLNAGAYPPVHTNIIRDLLRQRGVKNVLDAGCGPASMLRDLDLDGVQRFGFDLTPEMTTEARRVLGLQGVPANQIWEGSVLDRGAFKAPGGQHPEGFDAAICFGVLPHVPAGSDAAVLSNLAAAVRPGGVIACEARNTLFALFTLNRYSRELFREQLVQESDLLGRAGDDAEREALTQALAQLDERFRMDLPPLRKGYENEPGYDEVLSRTHNPFELRVEAERAGLSDVQLLFYHYHALPPMLEKLVPRLFRAESVAMEDPHDWRGHFMASAFIVTGVRR
jgi:SAM-dependent methyltransferase